MAAIKYTSELFDPPPMPWGLRGDPSLWAEMSSVLADVPLPTTRAQLSRLLEEVFVRLVGVPADSSAFSIFVERYGRGGMSSGHVCFAFWRETAFPLLTSRHAGA